MFLKTRNILTGLVLLALGFVTVSDVKAIPAFARRYKLSCSTCHSPAPRLKAFGADFAGNGFILPEEEKERDYVSAGDDLLWLNRTFPVAVRFDAYVLAEDNTRVESDLQTPWGLKLLSGGTLYKNIGYYFYFFMSERGEVAGIEDAYVHFNDLFGSRLDVLVGQFQTSDPLMKRELRLTFEDYQIYRIKAGASQANLTYDRGLMFLYGIEATGTDLAALVVNGNGKGAASEADKKFDHDNHKNLAFRIIQSIGPHVSIGAFGYTGKEREDVSGLENGISYWGPDLAISAGPIDLTAQYLERKDTNPAFIPGGQDVTTRGMIVEMTLSPKLDRSRFYLTGLYNWIDSDQNDLDYQTATLSGTYLLSRNLRLMAEYTRDLERDANRVVAGIVSAF